MNEELRSFVEDLISIFKDKYNQTLIEAQKAEAEADVYFQQGANFAYYDALDLVRSQLEALGHDIEKLGSIVPELGKRAHPS